MSALQNTQSQGPTTILQCKNVTKVYGKKVILDRANLSIQRKDIFGLIGSSGSGKTTLLEILIGSERPEEGDVLFQPVHLLESKKQHMFSVFRKRNEVKKSFGFAAQEPSFYPKLTVKENLFYFASLYGLPRGEANSNVTTLVELLDLSDSIDERAENLSGGMQKRLDIGCALIHDPSVLILDEPTSNLDPLLRKQMWDLIKKINKRGTTILLASHFLDEVEAVCNSIAILHNHKIIKTGSPESVKGLLSQTDVIYLETSPGDYDKIKAKLSEEKHIKINSIVVDGKKLVIHTPVAEKVLHDILHILEKTSETLIDVDVAKPGLSQIFEELERREKLGLEDDDLVKESDDLTAHIVDKSKSADSEKSSDEKSQVKSNSQLKDESQVSEK